MDRFQAYLFARHTEEQVRRWAVSLTHFRFCRAYGGHANASDHFLAALGYSNEDELLTVFASLGLTPNTLPPDNPRPVPGQRYSHEVILRTGNRRTTILRTKAAGRADFEVGALRSFTSTYGMLIQSVSGPSRHGNAFPASSK